MSPDAEADLHAISVRLAELVELVNEMFDEADKRGMWKGVRHCSNCCGDR